MFRYIVSATGFLKKGKIGNFLGGIASYLSFICMHFCAILLIIKNVTMKNSKIKTANCPNCWGHQEYACTSIEPSENRVFNKEEPNFIRRFVEQHVKIK